MWVLVGTTITASFFDSLNPSAIAQQMLLQAMVKKKRKIWFFIAGIGTANFVMGLAIYYGVAAWASRLLGKVIETFPSQIAWAAAIGGFACAAIGILFFLRVKFGKAVTEDGEEAPKLPAQLSAPSLFIMGAAFCMVELTSALPYFGFLAMMATYDPALPIALGLICLYNFIYMLPLILLYFGYNRLRGTRIIKKLESIMGKVASYIVPVVVILVGVLLFYYGVESLL